MPDIGVTQTAAAAIGVLLVTAAYAKYAFIFEIRKP